MEQEKQKSTYLALLIASLEKKSKALDQLLILTETQEKYIDKGDIDTDEFDQLFDKKEKQIQELLKLDKGFEQIFEYVKDEITQNKEKYINETKKLQELITQVTDKNITLQALEQRNRMKLDTLMRTKRSNIKNFKLSSKTAASYYKNMANQHQGQAYFFDIKK
jgi:Na+/phosphate symporter